MLRVGIAGIGFIGMIHFLAYRKTPGAKVRALCEQDEKRLAGDWRDIKGNFGPAGTQMDLSGIATYRDLGEMIADPNLDVIDVCLPPGLHADVTVAALKAGKHVFCEKPIALTDADARRMVAEARAADRQLLVGHVLPFMPEYAFAYRTIRDGKYGKLLGGNFKRIIADPLWLPNYYQADKIGGPLLDLHIHDAHFIRLAFGMPTSVSSRGRMRGEVVEFAETQFIFDDPALVVAASTGVIGQQGRSFAQSFEIYLERATLLFDFAVIDGKANAGTPLTVLDSKGKVVHPQLGAGDPVDGFVAELKEVMRSIRTGEGSKILGCDLARDALLLCHKQTQSVRSGKPVKMPGASV
jgi:predicted dehydrogenase